MTVIYYRWAYSPSSGDVTLSHNHESHPAEISFHSDMAASRPEKDLVFGYIYRMEDGWKVTDDEHKPIMDPHILTAVEAKVKEYDESSG